jgi:ribosomal-protein-alanine N-acetyltransferase
MPNVREIENSSLKFVTSVSLLSRFYEIIPEGFLVAEIHGKIVGYIIGNMQNESEGHILAIAVDPKYRKQGIGTVLIKAICKVLTKQGANKARVELKLYNTGAKEFYSNMGFEESNIIKGYYRMRGYTEDALNMTKNLSYPD